MVVPPNHPLIRPGTDTHGDFGTPPLLARKHGYLPAQFQRYPRVCTVTNSNQDVHIFKSHDCQLIYYLFLIVCLFLNPFLIYLFVRSFVCSFVSPFLPLFIHMYICILCLFVLRNFHIWLVILCVYIYI